MTSSPMSELDDRTNNIKKTTAFKTQQRGLTLTIFKMYRAYPTPPQASQQQSNKDPNKNRYASPTPGPPSSQGGGVRSGAGRTGVSSYTRREMRVPPAGLSLPNATATRSVAPPMKKQRAMLTTSTNNQPDDFTKIADDAVAKRRAEMNKVGSRRSNTLDLLSRARAVNPAGAGHPYTPPPPTTTSSSTSSTTSKTAAPKAVPTLPVPPRQQANTNGSVPSYPARTRPLTLPKSPPRPTLGGSNQAPPTPPIPHSSNKINGNIGSPNKPPPQPNPTPQLPTSHSNTLAPPPNAKRRPMSPPPSRRTSNAVSNVSSTGDTSNLKPPPQLPTSHSNTLAPPLNGQRRPMSPPPSRRTSNAVSNVSPTKDNHLSGGVVGNTTIGTVQQQQPLAPPQPTQNNNYNNNNNIVNTVMASAPPPGSVPVLVAEQNKRDTFMAVRNAAQSPNVSIVQTDNERQIQTLQDNNINNDTTNTSSHSKLLKELIETKSSKELALKEVAELQREVAELRIEKEKTAAMADACVGTKVDDFPQGEMQQQREAKPPKQEIETSSTDALSSFILFFSRSLIGVFWFFITIPFKMMKWTVLSSMFVSLLSMMWLYIADDNGATALGAGIDFHLNSPQVH